MSGELPAVIEREFPKLNENQLRLLNQRIVEKLKLISRAKALNSLAQFNIGDIVSFDHYGEIIKGQIIRINQKTASIVTMDSKQKWNVHPNFLIKETSTEHDDSDNVTEINITEK